MKLIIKTLAIICLILTAGSNPTFSQQELKHWTNAEKPQSMPDSRTWMPVMYRFMNLDLNGLKEDLREAPKERAKQSKPIIIELPMPDGSSQRFSVCQTQVMHPHLAQAFPNIKTFSGQGIDDGGAILIMDFTQFGFHGFILSPKGVVYIDPIDLSNTSQYLIYYRKDVGYAPEFNCLTENKILTQSAAEFKKGANTIHATGDVLSSYRLALACTGEYAQFYGGTVAGALAGIVTSVNRVDGIYEKELAVSLELIPNDTLLIYTNPSTDGFSNGNPGSLLNENQYKCHTFIGDANYDIGHVFSTAGGGLAGLGVVCSDASKARGETGLSNPVGDAFDVDYVAHEMGHQFGGNHSFNSQTGACNGNGNHSTAYEPGSGITIMAYAGICGSDNLSPNSIPTFHAISYDEITTFTLYGDGGLCSIVTNTGNTAPTVTPPGNYIIPYKTPFHLEATGSDPDGDTVYYSWEQFDHNNTFCAWNAPTGNAPIFRSFNPTESGKRYFPKISNVINNNTTIGEILPTYARFMHFRCTVRDNRTGGGGVSYNDPPVSVQAINTGTGFAITDPNTTGITWQGLSQQIISWDVAQSDVAPVSTPTVNILLSIDGGYTYTYTLASGVPNNGSASIIVPNGITTTTARVMVEGAGNIFYDINNFNIAIQPGFASVNELRSEGISVYPNPANETLQIEMGLEMIGNISFKLIDNTGRIVKTEMINAHSQKNKYALSISDLADGIYSLRIETNFGNSVKKIVKM